jgi:hypothetical protein
MMLYWMEGLGVYPDKHVAANGFDYFALCIAGEENISNTPTKRTTVQYLSERFLQVIFLNSVF